MVLAASRLWAVERPSVEDFALPAWQKGGLCREHPSVSWFPERGESAAPAKAICRRCTVRNDCLNYALSLEGRVEGVWGATSPRERRRINKIVSRSGRTAQ